MFLCALLYSFSDKYQDFGNTTIKLNIVYFGRITLLTDVTFLCDALKIQINS